MHKRRSLRRLTSYSEVGEVFIVLQIIELLEGPDEKGDLDAFFVVLGPVFTFVP